jgi:hypothetical protein
MLNRSNIVQIKHNTYDKLDMVSFWPMNRIGKRERRAMSYEIIDA